MRPLDRHPSVKSEEIMRPIWSFVVTMLIVVPAAPALPWSSGATYVPGEVIVKLPALGPEGRGAAGLRVGEGRGGTIHALSQEVTTAQRRQVSLSRLRTRHGLEGGVPIDGRAGQERVTC